jgi:hypothetical protein
MSAKSTTALCFGIALVSSLDWAGSAPASLFVLTQGELRIPSDAQLEQLERQGIATPTLDVSDAPAMKGSEESQDRQMERRSRAIDQKVMKGICSDC